jgi:hypothetical protein
VPVFAADWTEVEPLNDPEYTLSATNSLEFQFSAMEAVASTNADMTLGIVLYTTTAMAETGTADAVTFHNVSLCANKFPVQSPTLTFNEDLEKCQYYFEMSYGIGTDIGTATVAGSVNIINAMTGITAHGKPFDLNYLTRKRASPTNTFYSPSTGTINQYDFGAGNGASWVGGANAVTSAALGLVTNTPFRAYYTNVSSILFISSHEWTRSSLHYTANARLGE